MSYTSGFFDAIDQGGGNYDRVYSAATFAHYFSLLVKNGVFPDPSTGLQVRASSSPDMKVSVSPGSGWINGYYITVPENSPEVLTVPTANPSLSRIDSVIMGLNYVKREIQLYIKPGAVSASPIPVSLQRDNDLYELELAQISVAAGVASIVQANITDMRQNTSRCGIVKGTIDQIDTTDLFAQYDDAFQTWFDNIQAQLEGNVVTNLQKQIDERLKIASISTEPLLASEFTKSLYGLSASASPNDLFLALFLGTGKKGYTLHMYYQDGSPVSNKLITGLTTPYGEALYTDESGYAFGVALGDSVTISINFEEFMDVDNFSKLLTSTSPITDLSVTIPSKTDTNLRILSSGSSPIGFSPVVKEFDVFCVGGGGNGTNLGSGGGGGYTTTQLGIKNMGQTSTPIVGGSGGNTSFFGVTAKRGENGSGSTAAAGGAGGSGGGGSGFGSGSTRSKGGAGGSDGGRGGSSQGAGGAGQGRTTRAFGESDGELFSGGGAGGGTGSSAAGGAGGGGAGGVYGGSSTSGYSGTPNTGGGGGSSGGSGGIGGSGGSGIILVRWRYS